MGATLNTASGMGAYVMSDRASWLKFNNKGDLTLLYAGDPVLFNQYAYLPLDPKRHPHVDTTASAKTANGVKESGDAVSNMYLEFTAADTYTLNFKDKGAANATGKFIE